MAMRNSWAGDAIDAVNITLTDGDVAIAASDDEQVHLHAGRERDRLAGAGVDRVEQVGRWLLVHLMARRDGEPLTVYLPRSKSWQVEVSTAHGDVAASEIEGRLHVMTGQGDVHLTHCHGVFDVGAGAGDIALEHCRQAAVPATLPIPGSSVENGPAEDGGRGSWFSAPARSMAAAMATLERRLARLPGRSGAIASTGVTINGGSGDVEVEHLEAETCSIRIGRGDVSLQDGAVGRLYVSAGQGDIECVGVTPQGQWEIETVHGDISLALPDNVPLRLDAATSHGEIHSDAPLVRVARPGPEARHGGRMVGSFGRADAQSPQISLTTSTGDIEIELAAPSGTAPEPVQRSAAVHTDGEDARASHEPQQTVAGSEMEVLQALSDGIIDAGEAERLLRGFGV